MLRLIDHYTCIDWNQLSQYFVFTFGTMCQYSSGTSCALFLFCDRHRYLFNKLVINHYFILCFITPIFLADNRWLLFPRIPSRTLAFHWSPWRAGSPRRKSLPNGKRSRSSWWDWRKLRRKANPDTHTGPRPGQGSLIDARHYYWVPVRIISFVVLTHGATVTTPLNPLFVIECKNSE